MFLVHTPTQPAQPLFPLSFHDPPIGLVGGSQYVFLWRASTYSSLCSSRLAALGHEQEEKMGGAHFDDWSCPSAASLLGATHWGGVTAVGPEKGLTRRARVAAALWTTFPLTT